jgi:hypothetical protein
MPIFVYMCSGLPESRGSKMASVTGEGIVSQMSIKIKLMRFIRSLVIS